jgi:hypothetical protein
MNRCVAMTPPCSLLEDGVRCYSPAGELIGKIHLPEI